MSAYKADILATYARLLWRFALADTLISYKSSHARVHTCAGCEEERARPKLPESADLSLPPLVPGPAAPNADQTSIEVHALHKDLGRHIEHTSKLRASVNLLTSRTLGKSAATLCICSSQLIHSLHQQARLIVRRPGASTDSKLASGSIVWNC